MQIALYDDEHHLPFWHKPQQPQIMFNPGSFGDHMIEVRDKKATNHPYRKEVPCREVFMWPILEGIFAIDISLLAHVSVGFSQGKFHHCEQIWVQFTTIPTGVDALGLPLVISPETGKPLVQSLCDSGTYSPWYFEEAKPASPAEKMSALFWQNFFESQFRKAKDRAVKNAEEAILRAEKTFELYKLIT